MMRTGPNDVSGIIWVIGMFIFTFILCFYILTNVYAEFYAVQEQGGPR